MLRSATTRPGACRTAAAMTCSSSFRPSSSSSLVTPSARTCSTKDVSVGTDAGELQGGLRLVVSGAEFLLEQRGHLRGPDLLEFVDAAENARGVREPDPGVEALGQLAVVDPQQEIGDGQRIERLGDHERDFNVVAERQLAVADNVDVRLGELAGPSLLGTFAAPDLLDLVAAEREGQVAGVFHDVPGEGHGEVEVQGKGVRDRSGASCPLPLPGAGSARRPLCRFRPCAATGPPFPRRGSRSRRNHGARTSGAACPAHGVPPAAPREATRGILTGRLCVPW